MPKKIPDNTRALGGSNSSSTAKKLYSPKQAACAAWVGGPLAAMYCIRENYLELSQPKRAQQSVYWGGGMLSLYLALAMLVPENLPFLLVNAALGMGIMTAVRKFQLSKEAIQQSPEYDFHTDGNVVGVALIANAASFIVLIPLLLGAAALGSVSG